MTDAKCIIVAGPTASGKSDFAHRLARRVGGVIINCDSVQIYRNIENISASPMANRAPCDEIDGVPYRLFSILDLDSHLSVGEYLNLARREYDAAIADGKIPIFVGGTGYYINAIINGISPMPEISDENRASAREMVATDIDSVRKMLPPEFTATDPQRVARAAEVFLQTGHHITEFQSVARTGAIAPNALRVLISPDAEILRNRIARRIGEMLTAGAVAEATNIIANNQNPNRAIGATELGAYLRGETDMETCIRNWTTKTNQYAKRQRTWFRTQFAADITITHVPTDADINAVASRINDVAHLETRHQKT